MARTRTLTLLLDDVRKAADIENATDRFPDSELTEYINQSIARLYTYLDKWDSTHYQSTQTISTVSGTKTYALASDFWTLKGVRIVSSGNVQFRAYKFTPEQGQWLDVLGTWGVGGMPIYYRLQGNNIVFSPVPTGTYTVFVDYAATPQRLVSGSDTFDGIAGFERWVIVDAAIRTKQKDSLDTSLLMAEKSELEAWIQTMATSRDVGAPEVIQDVQCDNAWGWPVPWGW